MKKTLIFRDPQFNKDPFPRKSQQAEASVYTYKEGLAILKDPAINIAEHTVLLDNEVLAAIKEPDLVAELVKQQLLMDEQIIYKTKVVNNYSLKEIKLPHVYSKTTAFVITGKRQTGKTTHALDLALSISKETDPLKRKCILYVGMHVNAVEVTKLHYERLRPDTDGVEQIRYLTVQELKKRMVDAPNRVLSDYAVVVFDDFEILSEARHNRFDYATGTVKLSAAISNVVPNTIYVLN